MISLENILRCLVCMKNQQIFLIFSFNHINFDSQHENINIKYKVVWDFICVPKDENGLGLKQMVDWNRAAILRHI
jgi:hypothetical protein